MKLLPTEIRIGVKNPIKLIHAGDTHLTLADERDDERKRNLAEKRRRYFPNHERMVAELEQYAKETGYPILHTGDLIDFVSVANLERVKKFTSACEVFAAAGNHEFSLYVGEAREDAAYRNQAWIKFRLPSKMIFVSPFGNTAR